MKDKHNEDIKEKLGKVEETIADLIGKENRDKILNNFKKFSDTTDSVSRLGVWAVVRKVFPKISTSVPMGKRDHKGKIITNPIGLKSIYKRTFKDRLRSRQARPKFEEIYTEKDFE